MTTPNAAAPLDAAEESALIPAAVRRILPYWALGLAVLLAYGNIFDNVFLFDDDLLIRMNSYLPDWTKIGALLSGSTTSGAHIAGGFFRPLQMLLYLFAYQLGNGHEFFFHLLNLSLHAANACLMYRLGTKLGFAPSGAFCAALLWAVHPLHTEAITYMSGTADPLFVLFALSGMLYLLPEFAPGRFVKVIPLFLLGLLSKETMVMFPLLAAVTLFATRDDARWSPRLYLRLAPLVALAALFALWRVTSTHFDGPATYARLYDMHSFSNLKLYADSLLSRIYTLLATIPAYLTLLVWPHDLHMERSFSVFTIFWVGPVIVGFLLACAAVGFVLFAFRAPSSRAHKLRPLAWGILWAFAAHAPDSGLLVPMNSLFLEHWMYMPSVGLFLGLAETSLRLIGDRRRLAMAVAALLFIYAGLLADKTYAQNRIWKDPSVFYGNISAHGERSARALNNLALYYSEHGAPDKALEEFGKAVAVSDSYAETRHNMALTYLQKGMTPENIGRAIEQLKRAVVLDPKFYRSWETLAYLLDVTGRSDEAKQAHAMAAKTRPSQ